MKTSYISAKTKNQRDYILSIINKDITICVGQAGCGKTIIPLGIGLERLMRDDDKCNKLVITRPLVSVGKDIGSLPGSIEERIFPYFRPAYFNLLKMIKDEKALKNLIEKRSIMFEPLELMRGMTYDNAILILDEAQDTLPEQMLMFLTRLGFDTKIIVNGDLDQSDIKGENGLMRCIDAFEGRSYADIIRLGPQDQQRNSLINNIHKDFTSGRKCDSNISR